MNKYSALIVDDEPHAREDLIEILSTFDFIEILGECKNGLEAIEIINNEQPDIVFLDIEMPEVDGFQVVENIETDTFPYIIFVTAFSEYAIKAFEAEAIDYIHKPYNEERIAKTLERIQRLEEKNNKSSQELKENIQSVIQKVNRDKYQDRFIVKESGKYFLVPKDDIYWFEADGNYLRIVTENKKYFVRHTLSGMEEYLDPELFYRVSRSTIVNIDWVNQIQDHYYGNFIIEMKNGKELKMTKNYKRVLEDFKQI